jgi:hypothetical protein
LAKERWGATNPESQVCRSDAAAAAARPQMHCTWKAWALSLR